MSKEDDFFSKVNNIVGSFQRQRDSEQEAKMKQEQSERDQARKRDEERRVANDQAASELERIGVINVFTQIIKNNILYIEDRVEQRTETRRSFLRRTKYESVNVHVLTQSRIEKTDGGVFLIVDDHSYDANHFDRGPEEWRVDQAAIGVKKKGGLYEVGYFTATDNMNFRKPRSCDHFRDDYEIGIIEVPESKVMDTLAKAIGIYKFHKNN